LNSKERKNKGFWNINQVNCFKKIILNTEERDQEKKYKSKELTKKTQQITINKMTRDNWVIF